MDVEATSVELQTQDAVTGQGVDRRLINSLPLLDRNFLDLAFLAPGVTEVDTQCQGCLANNFVSNGSRGATADILLDGARATNFGHPEPDPDLSPAAQPEGNAQAGRVGEGLGQQQFQRWLFLQSRRPDGPPTRPWETLPGQFRP